MSTERSDREIIDAATPGPWRRTTVWQVESEWIVASNTADGEAVIAPEGGDVGGWEADAEFIAAARTRWPAALDRVSQLEKALRDAIGRCSARRRIAPALLLDSYDCREASPENKCPACRAALTLLDAQPETE